MCLRDILLSGYFMKISTAALLVMRGGGEYNVRMNEEMIMGQNTLKIYA
jgi:hypothetical protein